MSPSGAAPLEPDEPADTPPRVTGARFSRRGKSFGGEAGRSARASPVDGSARRQCVASPATPISAPAWVPADSGRLAGLPPSSAALEP